MELFYQAEISENEFIIDQEEARHCIKVLRLKNGDTINLTDGKDFLYSARIINIDKRGCVVKVIDKETVIPSFQYKLHIAIAPPKNIERFEWFCEKAVEIGISEITPLITEHSERRVLKTERIEKILIAAMKQSIKFRKPILNEAITFSQFIRNQDFSKVNIAHCQQGEKILLKNIDITTKNYVICIGPEGDFSKNEIEQAYKLGIKSISLGDSRLRTETAGIVACSTISVLHQ